jgi:hypothetical protein
MYATGYGYRKVVRHIVEKVGTEGHAVAAFLKEPATDFWLRFYTRYADLPTGKWPDEYRVVEAKTVEITNRDLHLLRWHWDWHWKEGWNDKEGGRGWQRLARPAVIFYPSVEGTGVAPSHMEREPVNSYPGKNRWSEIKIRMKANSFDGDRPLGDGLVACWVDGRLVYDDRSAVVRLKPVGFEVIRFGSNWSGSTDDAGMGRAFLEPGSVVAQDWDEIVLSREDPGSAPQVWLSDSAAWDAAQSRGIWVRQTVGGLEAEAVGYRQWSDGSCRFVAAPGALDLKKGVYLYIRTREGGANAAGFRLGAE